MEIQLDFLLQDDFKPLKKKAKYISIEYFKSIKQIYFSKHKLQRSF